MGSREEKPALGRDIAKRVGEGFDETGGVAQVGELGVVLGGEGFDPRGRNGRVRVKGRMWIEHWDGFLSLKTDSQVKTKRKR